MVIPILAQTLKKFEHKSHLYENQLKVEVSSQNLRITLMTDIK